MTTNNTKHLPIHVNGYDIIPNEDGMYDLTAFWKASGLSETKKPSEWRTKMRDLLFSTAKIAVHIGRDAKTLATEEAAIAYAMWVSDEFYLLVIDVFIAARNDAMIASSIAEKLTEESKELFKKNSKAIKCFDRFLGLNEFKLADACRISGIEHPNLFADYLCNVTHHLHILQGKKRATKQGESVGFYNRAYPQGAWSVRMNREGLKWLLDNAEYLNEEVTKYKDSLTQVATIARKF
ncbi:TPA: KilA-N domain-containing protein [Vibrio harveyi]